MISTPVRLFVGAILVALLAGATHLVEVSKRPPPVEFPDRDFQQIPLQLGPWRGKTIELNPRITASLNADVVVDRFYRDDSPYGIKMHVALFGNPDKGIYHSPINCYRANGWQVLADRRFELSVTDEVSFPVRLVRWEKEGERALVCYWYQLGGYLLFDRFELGGIRWKMRGQKAWPALIKVMLEIPATDPDEAETRISDFAKHVYKWINQPEPKPTSSSPSQQLPPTP